METRPTPAASLEGTSYQLTFGDVGVLSGCYRVLQVHFLVTLIVGHLENPVKS